MRSEASILTPQEMQTIRMYVQSKYAGAPQRHPEIFADAIRRVLMRELPELAEPQRQAVATALIRERVLGERRAVRTEDIWRATLAEMPDPGEEELQALLRWAQARAAGELSEQQLRAAIQEVSSPDQCSWSLLVGRTGFHASDGDAEVTAAAGSNPIWIPRWRQLKYAVLSLLVIAAAAIYAYSPAPAGPLPPALPDELKLRLPLSYSYVPALPDGVVNELPEELRYVRVEENRLRSYLESRNSLLAEEPYYRTLMETAWRYDIHPLLFFAITGQEQGFVPRDHPEAARIANNPFNVFHSWQTYNTTIDDSADIAARTVLRWARERPPQTDPLEWINRRYAEDPGWAAGVRRLFESMQSFGDS
ncbi:hypothetical protein [Paenibacillus sp. 1P07SE]|uniref:hypothetical protein n=1 Tax=Paenibacillus sp. 1P07SE TaxID=3132209 RepID=UPI0039A68860